MASAYSSPGNHKTGVWLVSLNGKAAVVDKAHLPMQGKGYEYYWLGATRAEAYSRFFPAMARLGVITDQIPTDLGQAFSHGFQNLNFDLNQPGLLPGQSPSPRSGYAQGIHQAGQAAQKGAQVLGSALSLTALFSNIGLWKGVGMVIAGGILILIGILNLAGVDAGGVARRVIP